MNKQITAAFEAAKNDPTNENTKALADLAVPKFKEVYGRIQKAVRTVNRHLGVNKGTPNRATIATAIGLADELTAYKTIGGLINEQTMTDAAQKAIDAVMTIADMRKTAAYDHIAVLPDYFTTAEIAERNKVDAKRYLCNITNAVRAAIDTINRHIVDRTFDVNTYKIAKVVGYVAELPDLRARLTEQTDIDAFEKLNDALNAVLNSKNNGFMVAVHALPEYDPFPTAEEEELTEGEEDGEE